MTNLHVAVIGVVLLILPFIVLGAWCGVAYRYLDYLESVFSNSPMVGGNKSVYSRAGWLGKILRVGSIAVMLSVAEFSVRKKLLARGDVEKLPQRFRRLLVSLLGIHVMVFCVFVGFGLWVKLWSNY